MELCMYLNGHERGGSVLPQHPINLCKLSLTPGAENSYSPCGLPYATEVSYAMGNLSRQSFPVINC